MGFAHSYEAWHEGKLAGGGFGVQLGALICCDSMFHRVSNASKAAYGQTLFHLQKRGFKIVDTNGVANYQVKAARHRRIRRFGSGERRLLAA